MWHKWSWDKLNKIICSWKFRWTWNETLHEKLKKLQLSHPISNVTLTFMFKMLLVPVYFLLFVCQVALTKPWCVFAVPLDLQSLLIFMSHFLHIMMFLINMCWGNLFGIQFLIKTPSYSTVTNEITSNYYSLVIMHKLKSVDRQQRLLSLTRTP